MSDLKFRHVSQNIVQNTLTYNLTFNALISDFNQRSTTSVTSLSDSNTQLKGMIHIQKSYGVSLSNLTFTENWLFESFFSRR